MRNNRGMSRIILCLAAIWIFLCMVFVPVIKAESFAATGAGAASAAESTEEADEERENGTQQTDRTYPNLGLTARSAVLMEASTGQILYEMNGNERLSPASITKIMTLILIFDALKAGTIRMEDLVTTSDYARSMTGSKVFLERGETQDVETMIKCIVVASGNDASVAMAEHLAGSETEFVRRMNEKAAALGMKDTHFEDCCGLTENPEHLTTARDVAVMSRTLINEYPQISRYSTIWMENITHVTAQGSKEFTLTNTNKLLKMANSFQVTGLKTGSTSRAKYCVSATAEKEGVRLIAVIMAAPDYKVRFAQAQTLLNYGYANCRLYTDSGETREPLAEMRVHNGKKERVTVEYEKDFSYLALDGEDLTKIEKQMDIPESAEAPVRKGDRLGELVYYLDGQELGRVGIMASEDVEEAGFLDYMARICRIFVRKPAA